MKTLKKIKIENEKTLSDYELINLKGGYGRSECCDVSGTASGDVHFCSDDPALMESWKQVWIAAGYSPSCYNVYEV